ncbi:hypothetical protein KI387_042888 [Taxus chinensis]|uniref:Uncharacterized protein n=1 Tax=Taxus chinensis TaxID=29808 RepID=A0AA38F6X2_TAXCH|nr:hypothetical protein KI387_042888 [Taxus chinensis]
MGHCIPSLDLAKLLASHCLAVSYVTTPTIARRLEGPVDESRQVSGLDIRLVGLTPPSAIEGVPEGRESMDLLPPESTIPVFSFVENLRLPFDSWMENQGVCRPVCIISDMFIDWTVQSSERFQIPRVVFATCGAFGTSVLHAVCDALSKNALKQEGDCIIVENVVSSALIFTREQIPGRYFDADQADPRLKILMGKMESISKCRGILFNSFDGLESRYLQYWIELLSGKPIWSVGPVIPLGCNAFMRGKSADISEDMLLQWLDAQRPRSVVYVSFGSQTFLSQEQIMALARGLEASNQAFIWSIKVSPENKFSCRFEQAGI